MKRKPHTRIALPIAGLFVMLAALAAPGVVAHEVHRHDVPRAHRSHRAHPRHPPAHVHVRSAPPRFVIPARLDRREHRRLAPYSRGSVWYAPHRHRHAVYSFPVRFDGVWVERPHYYCEGALYERARIRYDGPRISFRIGF
jgi:hypothetical protein